MDTSVYIRRVLRDDEENREKAQRLETAIMEAEAIGDFTQLNKLAAFEARTMTTKGFVFKDIFELLDGQLPTMAGALSFKYRVELCAYLGFLKKEYDSLMEQAPSEWRDKKFKQLMCKKKEVELLLSGETELVSTNDEATNQGDSEAKTIKNKKFEHPETIAWKEKAWEIGKNWFDKEPKKGKYPGVIHVAKYVEGELSNQGIKGPRGKFLDWETIKREALTGITGRAANGKSKKL